jgi:hypothetical protein
MTWLLAPRVLLLLALPAVIFVIAVVVRKLRAAGDSGDFVAQSVLVRINADYRERH